MPWERGPLARKNKRLQAIRPLSDDDTPLDEGGTGPRAYADAVATYLAFGLSADLANRDILQCVVLLGLWLH